MNFEPSFNQVVIEPMKDESPFPSEDKKPRMGRVIDVNPDREIDVAAGIRAGDILFFQPFAYTEVKYQDQVFHLVRLGDEFILGRIPYVSGEQMPSDGVPA